LNPSIAGGRGSGERKQKRTGLKAAAGCPRENTTVGVFKPIRYQFNRRKCFAFFQKIRPSTPRPLTLAIAQKVFTTYATTSRLRWRWPWWEPLSPILGWEIGGEWSSKIPICPLAWRHPDGQQLESEFACLDGWNREAQSPKSNDFDPEEIGLARRRLIHDTDGDNVQWLEGNFFGNQQLWGNSDAGKIPFAGPVVSMNWHNLCSRRPSNTPLDTRTTNELVHRIGAGGYYYLGSL